SVPPTPYISPLSLHDALPIWAMSSIGPSSARRGPEPDRSSNDRWAVVRVTELRPTTDSHSEPCRPSRARHRNPASRPFSSSISRSEEHTSELQSLAYLVCRLL